MRVIPPTYVEGRTTDDPDRMYSMRSTPHSIIDHPFRIIVHDTEFGLMRLGTAALGPAGNPLFHAVSFAYDTPRWGSAIIFGRANLTLLQTLVKDVKDQHAPRTPTPR